MSNALSDEIAKLTNRDDFFCDLSSIRLPYPKVFVEIPITEAVQKIRTKNGNTGEPIKRIGATIYQYNNESTFAYWPVWEHTDGRLGGGAVALVVSPTPEPLITNKIFLNKVSPPVYFGITPCPMLIDIAFKHGVAPEKFAEGLMTAIQKAPSMLNDVLSEALMFLGAWTTLVNCKSGITTTHIDNRVVNASGKPIKKRDGPKYTVLSLSATETVASSGEVSERKDITAHFVRGHFKQRKTGVYWWRHFVRGKGEVTNRDAYLVRA